MHADPAPPSGGVRQFWRPDLASASGVVIPHRARTDTRSASSRPGLLWLAAVSIAFAIAVRTFTPVHMALGWDETVYASQISQHVPMLWSAERARGMPLLIAPVTLLTSSATVLRTYLTVLAGLGLFAALACWRQLRPDWVLALAGLVFGGLWIVESEASLVFPNFWIALGGLAGVGLFLRVVSGYGRRAGIVLLGIAAAATSLLRPPDAVVLYGPLLVAAAVLVIRARADWRDRLREVWQPSAAIVAGLVVGGGEWIAEAYLYFGGVSHRLQLESSAVGGTKFAPLDSLRILSGGQISSVPGYPSIRGWSDPWLLLWWLAFGLLALAGLYLTWRAAGWLLAVVPAFCAACEYLLYAFPARDATRYLQPAWLLLAIPAAEALAWLLTRRGRQQRVPAIALAAAFLVAELVTQHAVLSSQTAVLETGAAQATATTSALRQAGVQLPCVVTSAARPHLDVESEPVAYELGCRFRWTMRSAATVPPGTRVVVLVSGNAPPPPFAQAWHSLVVPGGVTAYLEPAGS